MKLSQTKVLEALGGSKGDLTKDQLAIALKEIEKTLDKFSIHSDDNDFESARLGDASNLVQLIRESL